MAFLLFSYCYRKVHLVCLHKVGVVFSSTVWERKSYLFFVVFVVLLLGFRYWGKSEPNDDKGVEDCTETNFHDSRDSWNDGPCGDKKYWICETKKTN